VAFFHSDLRTEIQCNVLQSAHSAHSLLSCFCCVVSGYQSGAFKEKIVFVRADPSRGVISTQAIAAFDQNTAEQTSGPPAPSSRMFRALTSEEMKLP